MKNNIVYLIISYIFASVITTKTNIMTAIQTLRSLQQEEINNGFVNGNLYNDLEDLIYGLENPESKLESVSGEVYGAKELKN